MAGNVIAVDDESFEAEVLGSKEPFLLDVTAAWCGPCRALAPLVERLATELAGKVRVGKMDIDESPRAAERLGIRGAPTLVVFAGGKERARHLGATTMARLRELVAG